MTNSVSVNWKDYTDSQLKALGREIGELRKDIDEMRSESRQEMSDLRRDVRYLNTTVTRWAGGLAVVIFILGIVLVRLVQLVGF